MADNRRAPSWWHPLPAMHHRHPKMVGLLHAHGTSGPHAFTVLLSEAAAKLHQPGMVKLGWDDFARYAGIDGGRDGVSRRLHELADLRLVEVIDEAEFGFTVRLVNWAKWDQAPKDPGAAERKRKQRERGRNAGDAAESP